MDFDSEDYRSGSGFTIDDLASSSRTLFYALNGNRNPEEWMSVPESKKEKWREVAGTVAQQCEMEVECEWKVLSMKCFCAFHGDTSNFEAEKLFVHLTWEAIARNLVNAITVEEAGDLQSLGPSPEDYWADWLIGKTNGEQRGEKIEAEDEPGDEDSYTGSRYG